MLHRRDERERRRKRGIGARQSTGDRLAVLAGGIKLYLGIEGAGERRVSLEPQRRTDGGGIRVDRPRRPHPEVPQGRFRPMQRRLRLVQLFVQNRGQLRELLTLEVGGHAHELIGDRIDGGGSERGVGSLQRHPHEVAVGVDLAVERLDQRRDGIGRRCQGELDFAARRQAAGGRHPRHPEAGADGVPRPAEVTGFLGPFLTTSIECQPVGAVPGDGQLVVAGPERLLQMQSSEER